MGYKYRVVEIGEYVLIIQREKNICFKMKKKEFEEEGDIKIREIIDGISKMRKKYDVTFPENKKQMNTIYLFVTDYCNLNCEFCAMRSNNKDIKKEKLSQLEVKEHVIDKIRKANPRKLIVSGGEPFVLEDILDILKELKENINTKIIVQTNATLLTEKTIKSLNGIINSIEISTAHYKNTEQLKEKIALLNKYKIDVVLTFTYQNEKEKMLLREIIDMAAYYDADFLLHFVDYAGSAADRDYPLLNYQERLKVYCYFAKYIIEKGYTNKRFAGNLFHAVELSHPCSAFGKMAAFFPDGNIYLCHSLVKEKYRIGSIEQETDIEQSIEKILSNDNVEKLFYMPNEKCKTCKFNCVCGGMCPALIEEGVDSDCTLRKIMFIYSMFIFDKNENIAINLERFIKFCEEEEYQQFL